MSTPDPTLLRLERGVGELAGAAVRRMEQQLPWFAALGPAERSMVGLVAQAGIAAFVAWYRRPGGALDLAGDVFGAAPRELTRSVTLQQTLQLLRTVVDVVDDRASLLAAPGAQQAVRESVLRFSREVAFAAAEIYAAAAEARGAWDARLEALVVDALARGESSAAIESQAAALGWHAAARVGVVACSGATGFDQARLDELRRAARALGADALVGVPGDRLVLLLGRAGDPLALVPALLPLLGDGPVVTGPEAASLGLAGPSVIVALAALSSSRAWPQAPRPVTAQQLLPERVLDGDPTAAPELLTRCWAPLQQEATLLETLTGYLAAGRSVEACARTLFVHPNTVRYRLRRIAAVTGRDPAEPRAAFELQLALVLGRLRPEAHRP